MDAILPFLEGGRYGEKGSRMLSGLRYKEITERPEKEQKKPIIFVFRKRKKYIPPLNHPWRRFKPMIQNNGYQQDGLQT
ncbi:MAG: hypothetical protein COV68_03335 [Nitrospirae bacterium CG11_big_fil_rev_8_21_14_0_20_41_14]|nr:MAG: hypothetical protein COV68_03335 [Nitrospirae bacterium CG11_big_fil_rev_8_21_14_0_20_41_14]